MTIILICGYAGSGKDTIGDILQKKGYTRYAFADELKEFTAKKHGFLYDLTVTQKGKNTNVLSILTKEIDSVRKFLIYESALAKKIYNDDMYWAKIVVSKIKENSHLNQYVITDWRYIAELNHTKELLNQKIYTIRVIRNDIVPLSDSSEHELDSIICDFTIHNNESLDNLIKQVEALPI